MAWSFCPEYCENELIHTSAAGLETQYPGNGRLVQRLVWYRIGYKSRKDGQNL